MKKYASVVLDTSIDKTLDYLIPEELLLSAKPGVRVEVPVRGSKRTGTILSLKDESEVSHVQPIMKVISEEVISLELFELALFLSKYYVSSLQKILRTMIPTSIREEIKPKTLVYLTLAKTKKEVLSIVQELQTKNPSQSRVLEHFLKAKNGIFLIELLKLPSITKSPIDTLLKKKILKAQKVLSDQSTLLLEEEFFPTKPKKLTLEQDLAFKKISHTIEENKFDVHLLYGVTGSGKTEIYLQAIQKALDLDRSSIMLVPEIALTSQTIERFRARFKEKIAVLHHRRSQGERFDAWQSIKSGEARIVIGARSAIFSPVKNLGLIIVDEEHDSSYKQSEEAPAIMQETLPYLEENSPNVRSFSVAQLPLLRAS